MTANESRKTGILRLRHLREVNEAKAEEMAEAAPRFNALDRKDAAPRVVSAFNLFQTPEPLAATLAGMFGTFGRTLEPSAGLGRLYRAVRNVDRESEIVMVDSSPECCGELYRATEGDRAARLVAGDFLGMSADRLGGLFDSVIMNPPFKQGADIRHVLHALALLKPGGRLAAIVANGPRQRTQLKPLASQWVDLPPGAFKESFTNVAAAIVVIDSPHEYPRQWKAGTPPAR